MDDCSAFSAVRLPPDSEIVADADEEIFVVYSLLQSQQRPSEDGKFRGLGHVDSRKDVLDITLDIKLSPIPYSNPRSGTRRAKFREKTITVTLAQDKTALRTRKGDTGSVLWKASIDFAHLVLNSIYSMPEESIFDPEKLRDLHVLELGSGTGFLGIMFAPLVGQFTATDIKELIPLIRKNLALNFPGWPDCPSGQGTNVIAQELDWVALSSASTSQRNRMWDHKPVDILLVVDCIYHSSLIPPLVETIDYIAIPDRTVVLIVVELRAEDAIREFLSLWLQKPTWQVWRIGNVVSMPYVAWFGRKSSHQDEVRESTQTLSTQSMTPVARGVQLLS